ncbi:tryptophan synthase subunit beta [Myroides albus]|uniref:Tryptophan synthase beta chain n=1 Tax=Myroides albus TaxID=2562892 RepID=A0A6I3LJE6_9FLAO|nr:tryptophan synthase subunit beta [Myroides albus]MTG97967.1 tryptophan synthase subunit beta [Myroides albus]UVD80258.1 tryptophan synthase subunit beta [Myroides albus]
MKYQVDQNGFYGNYGGAFIPEALQPIIGQLQKEYIDIINQADFQAEMQQLLKDYVGRPTPLYFAENLSKKYNTKVYLKREDLCHTGAHKINNTIGQILLAKRLGKHKIVAETGAGQHGVATATVCALMGMECIVFMGALDIERQAPNVARMKMLGAEVRPAMSGAKTLKEAVDEALLYWIENPDDTFYLIGSAVGPHPYPDMVSRFQSVISEEIRKQLLEKEGRETPDYVVACVGGGSNAVGAFYHFLEDETVNLVVAEGGGRSIEELETAATSFVGKDGVLHGSKTLFMQDENGEPLEAYSISAGLDYPGFGPLYSHMKELGRAEFFAVMDNEAMQAGLNLCKDEGIIPAIESSHALAILDKKQFKETDIVVINLSGRGDKDLDNYRSYFNF